MVDGMIKTCIIIWLHSIYIKIEKMMIRTVSLVLLFLIGMLLHPVFAYQPVQQSEVLNNSSVLNTDTVSDLTNLLKVIGLNISYGDSGDTIFSMVEKSLNTIISDLSSGDANGFTRVPLIQETFSYLGISQEEIVVNPENVSPTFEPIEAYNKKRIVQQI